MLGHLFAYHWSTKVSILVCFVQQKALSGLLKHLKEVVQSSSAFCSCSCQVPVGLIGWLEENWYCRDHGCKTHSGLNCFQTSFLPLQQSFISSNHHNGPFLYSRYWTGTSLQWRLMRGNIIKKRLMSFTFEKTPCISLSYKLVPVQYWEYENGLFKYMIYHIFTFIFSWSISWSIFHITNLQFCDSSVVRVYWYRKVTG